MKKIENKKFSGYWVAFGASLILFVHNGIMGTLGLFIPELVESLGASITSVSMGLTISSLVAFLISLFVGQLIVKFSPKYLLLIGSITCFLQCVLYGTAENLPMLYMGAFVEGITTGIATTTCISSVIKLWFVEKRASTLGNVIGGAMIGSALFNTIAGLLIEHQGYRFAYIALGVIALTIAVPANLIFVKKNPESVNQLPLGFGTKEDIVEIASDGLSLKESTRTISFWLVLIFGGLFAGLSMGFITFAPSFWMDNGMDPLQASFYFTLFSLLSVLATMSSGYIAAKFGNKIFIIYLHASFILGLVLAILGGSSLSALYIVASIIGASIGFACYTTMLPTIVTELFGSKEFEKITGIFMAINYLGLCLVSPICGTIRDITGSYIVAFVFLGIMATFSMLAILFALIKKSNFKK